MKNQLTVFSISLLILCFFSCKAENKSTIKSFETKELNTSKSPKADTFSQEKKSMADTSVQPIHKMKRALSDDTLHKSSEESPQKSSSDPIINLDSNISVDINDVDNTDNLPIPKTTNIENEQKETTDNGEDISDLPNRENENNNINSSEIKPAKRPEIETAQGSPNHMVFDALLKKHVNASGGVNYKSLKSDINQLDNYLASLESNAPQPAWIREEKLAYWLNAYNAYTLKLIVSNYPISSITKLEGGKPWDKKWIKIGGKTLSLNNIENDIIRPKFDDARIHFAVNCAAKSCPPLLNEAFQARTLNKQLQNQTQKFINNPQFTRIEKGKIEISKIFEWYAVDFDNLKDFISKYYKGSLDTNIEIQYMEYDWSLNKQ